MIDIHSHLLPNVDDGSKSMTETLSLLNDAEKDGITEIILTPHFMKNGEFRIKAPELIEKFNILKNTYQGSIKLNLGNELYIHPDLPELLERNEVLSLSETDYILVEFPFEMCIRDRNQIKRAETKVRPLQFAEKATTLVSSIDMKILVKISDQERELLRSQLINPIEKADRIKRSLEE